MTWAAPLHCAKYLEKTTPNNSQSDTHGARPLRFPITRHNLRSETVMDKMCHDLRGRGAAEDGSLFLYKLLIMGYLYTSGSSLENLASCEKISKAR
jgi:hypothetical protein